MNAMFLLSSKRLKKNPNPTGLCSSRNPKKTRAYARRSGEACRKKKTTLTPPLSPCVLANGLCARQTIPPATQVTTQKVRKLKGSQSLYQNSPSEDKEYCLNGRFYARDVKFVQTHLTFETLKSSGVKTGRPEVDDLI